MKLEVLHRTRYEYAGVVRDSMNEARLRPVTNQAQACEEFILQVQPEARVHYNLDFYRNWVHFLEVTSPHEVLQVEARSRVITRGEPLPVDASTAGFDTLTPARLEDDCFEFLQESHYVPLNPALWRFAVDAIGGEPDVWRAAQAINAAVHRAFRYDPAATHVHTTAMEAFGLRSGVCQDFTHVMLGMCRSLRLPARYVSGYIHPGRVAGEIVGSQATHAWCEVFVPGAGWQGLDPTNNKRADGGHVKVAVGRDYADVPPLKGVYRGTRQRVLRVEVEVREVG